MTNRLAVVPATYVKFSTMVDGTLRVVLDLEPKNMADAIGLFSKPGAPVAVARLTDSAAVAADRETTGAGSPVQGEAAKPSGILGGSRPAVASPAPDRRPIALAGRVKLACARSDFYDWLYREPAYQEMVFEAMEALAPNGGSVTFQAISEAVVKRLCGVERKRDILPETPAAERWQDIWFQFTHSGQGRAA